jgi:cytoskeletal protein CcmA (bactofilin family)
MEPNRNDIANIGKSVIIKGELSGSEDLYLDGEVEGNIDLHNHNLVIGPNGRVRANVQAKEVVIHGKVDGNIKGLDKVELKKAAQLNGDISTQRIVIEDGAYFRGAIDINRAEAKAEAAAQTFAPKAYTAQPAVSQVAGASVTSEKK